MVRGADTQKGFASSARRIWNFSPGITRTWPSKTEGNSAMIASVAAVGGFLGLDECNLFMAGAGDG